MIGHGYVLNLRILQHRTFELSKSFLQGNSAKTNRQDLASLLIKLGCF